VEYDFTAKLEAQLDDISGGRIDWKEVLRDFWRAFSSAVDETKGLTITNVIDALDEQLGPHFFPPREDGRDPRRCPACETGRLGLKLSRTGAFIGCSNYPDCRYTRPLAVPSDEGEEEAAAQLPRLLGHDPEGARPVTVRKGPFGLYIQLGDDEDPEKPRRVSLPKTLSPMEIDLDTALKLLALPREVGRHPETRNKVVAGLGRFGPYVRHGSTYKSIPDDEDVLTIGMNRAMQLLSEAKERPGAEPLRVIGEHPRDGEAVGVYKGRYGPYVKHGKTMASLPKGEEVDTITMDRAVELLDAKAAKGGGKGKAKAAAKGKAKAPAKAKTDAKAANGETRKAGAKAKANGNAKAEPAERGAPAQPAASKPARRTAPKTDQGGGGAKPKRNTAKGNDRKRAAGGNRK
jgi:DNA topoisomerase-1